MSNEEAHRRQRNVGANPNAAADPREETHPEGSEDSHPAHQEPFTRLLRALGRVVEGRKARRSGAGLSRGDD